MWEFYGWYVPSVNDLGWILNLSLYIYWKEWNPKNGQSFALGLSYRPCTGLIKSNWPLFVSASHKLSDLKFLRRIAHVINVLLTGFQVRTLSHIATVSMSTNALFAMQIKVCQLVVELRDLTGCVIYAGHVSSIACFISNIFNTAFVIKNRTRLLKITKSLQMAATNEPHTTRTYWIRRRPQ